MHEYMKRIHEGSIVECEQQMNVAELPWNPHPKFRGVALKHLVKGEATGGKLSCHLVRVDAGCEIGNHIHAENLELHEVLSGNGKAMLKDKEIPYVTGTCVVIPENLPHSVMADRDDLYLLAKFTPALV